MYEIQEEWKQEEKRRYRQKTKRDQGKQKHKQGQGEGRNRTSSPVGAPVQDFSGSSGEEERWRALKLSQREVEGAGGCHWKELEEDDLDLASARAAGGEEPIIQLTGSLRTSANKSSEDNQGQANPETGTRGAGAQYPRGTGRW